MEFGSDGQRREFRLSLHEVIVDAREFTGYIRSGYRRFKEIETTFLRGKYDLFHIAECVSDVGEDLIVLNGGKKDSEAGPYRCHVFGDWANSEDSENAAATDNGSMLKFPVFWGIVVGTTMMLFGFGVFFIGSVRRESLRRRALLAQMESP